MALLPIAPKGMSQYVKRARSKILIAMKTFKSEEFKKLFQSNCLISQDCQTLKRPEEKGQLLREDLE